MRSPRVPQVVGFLFCIAAVVISILNLKRVAGLGLVGIPAFFMVCGAGLMVVARRRKRELIKDQESFPG